MLQVLPKQSELVELAVLGKHNLPDQVPTIGFGEMISLSKQSSEPIIFHARRNDEMIQALLAKALGAKLKIAFTSTGTTPA